MQTRFNDKPVVTFSCLAICDGRDGILRDNGTAVTFTAYMPADKNKMKYTFNAFDEARERVLKMNLKKGSRIMVVAILKNFIDTDNICRQSFTVCLIDYIPADDNQLITKSDDQTVKQPLQKQPPTPMLHVLGKNPGPNILNYQRPVQSMQQSQQLMQQIVPKKRPYSFEQPEVDIDEFAAAIGNV